MAAKQKRRDTPVLDALNDAVKQATHLDAVTDGPAIEAARTLALKIDMANEYFDRLVEYAADNDLRPPSQDNVSIPTFLKYCESLGLTPAGRTRLEQKPKEGTGGKLAQLRSVATAGGTA